MINVSKISTTEPTEYYIVYMYIMWYRKSVKRNAIRYKL